MIVTTNLRNQAWKQERSFNTFKINSERISLKEENITPPRKVARKFERFKKTMETP